MSCENSICAGQNTRKSSSTKSIISDRAVFLNRNSVANENSVNFFPKRDNKCVKMVSGPIREQRTVKRKINRIIINN